MFFATISVNISNHAKDFILQRRNPGGGISSSFQKLARSHANYLVDFPEQSSRQSRPDDFHWGEPKASQAQKIRFFLKLPSTHSQHFINLRTLSRSFVQSHLLTLLRFFSLNWTLWRHITFHRPLFSTVRLLLLLQKVFEPTDLSYQTTSTQVFSAPLEIPFYRLTVFEHALFPQTSFISYVLDCNLPVCFLPQSVILIDSFIVTPLLGSCARFRSIFCNEQKTYKNYEFRYYSIFSYNIVCFMILFSHRQAMFYICFGLSSHSNTNLIVTSSDYFDCLKRLSSHHAEDLRIHFLSQRVKKQIWI